MRLFEIDGAIQQILERCEVDTTTGEVLDWREDMEAALDGLEMERGKIALHLAARVKEYELYADAIADEAKRLRERSAVLNRKAERLRDYIKANIRVGEKYQDERVQISWRKSEKVLIRDESMLDESLMRITSIPSLEAIKAAIKTHGEIAGAELETRQNLVVK